MRSKTSTGMLSRGEVSDCMDGEGREEKGRVGRESEGMDGGTLSSFIRQKR